MVRDLLRRCIHLARSSGGKGPDFYEALRLLGTATHCLEDYSAHSNYVELALIELGNEEVFPHVGRDARFEIEEAQKVVYPIVTGVFGGVDFLHSVCGEVTDKVTQSEIQELEGAITNADRSEHKSKIKDLLSQLPDGIFGSKDEAGKADELEENANAAAMGNMRITPKEPEEFTEQIGELVKQIYPIMEFHDEIMQSIAVFIEKIPILPELLEQVQDQVTIFVFSLLAPYILPILSQVKAELETGSSEVIASSREKQHIVFNDDYSTDPTHSMLSKDHFSNVLNEPAGRVASEILKWAIPQIVACWDGEADTESTIDRIIHGVFHHPACVEAHPDREVRRGREIMFKTVEDWWNSRDDQDDLLERLSRHGVQEGENHKGDDKGHGSCKPIGMASTIGGSDGRGAGNAQSNPFDRVGKLAGEAVGGGALGGLVGGIVGGIGGSLLGGAFAADEKKSKKHENYGEDGSYTQSYAETGHHEGSSYDDERYGRAQYQETQYPGGGRREEYVRVEVEEHGEPYSYHQRVETSGYSGSGGYERHEERRVQHGDEWRAEETREGFDRSGEYYSEEREYVTEVWYYDCMLTYPTDAAVSQRSIPPAMIRANPVVETRIRSASRRNAKSIRRKRRSAGNTGNTGNMGAVMKSQIAMLTNVIQVQVDTGVALGLANMNMVLMPVEATAKSNGMGPKDRNTAAAKNTVVQKRDMPMAAKKYPGTDVGNMAAKLGATATSNLSMELTLIAPVGTEILDMDAAQKRALDMDAKSTLVNLMVTVIRATVVQTTAIRATLSSLLITVLTIIALADTVAQRDWNMAVSVLTRVMELLGSLEALVKRLRGIVVVAMMRMNMHIARGDSKSTRPVATDQVVTGPVAMGRGAMEGDTRVTTSVGC
jgi:hypothetical protein